MFHSSRLACPSGYHSPLTTHHSPLTTRIDWWLVAASLGLVAVGVAAIQAATEGPIGSGPAARQLLWAGIALMAMILAAWPSYRLAETLAYVAFALSILVLVAVFWTEPVNGAQRWLRLGPIGIQPSELAKLAFVAALARYLARREGSRRFGVVLLPILLAAVPMALILKQPDLGTALLLAPVLLIMLFCAGVRTSHLAVIILAVVAAAALWVGIIYVQVFIVTSHPGVAAAGTIGMETSPAQWSRLRHFGLSPTQWSRISAFLEQRDTGPKPQGEGYQLYQSKLMVALGGVFGSDDFADIHLPFDHTDFIFSVVAGRWGLVGASAVLLFFLVVLWRGLRVAVRVREPFGRLCAVGLVAMLAGQGFINMAMTIGLAPITGVTLPFLSYGGSSLLTSFIAVGVLLNIARHDAPHD